MGTRTIFEFNHDMAHRISDAPEAFADAIKNYLRSASPEAAEQLELFGVRRHWWGSSYDDRKLVTKFDEKIISWKL